MNSIKIVRFRNKHQEEINTMMLTIANEFDENIFSPNSVPIRRVAHTMGNQFWVTLHDKEVIGTIGIMRMNAQSADLKSLFVYKEYRGSVVASLLLNRLLAYARERSIRAIYVGTMLQFKAAQRFYEKNGFKEIKEEDLPAEFNRNPLDGIFYRMELG